MKKLLKENGSVISLCIGMFFLIGIIFSTIYIPTPIKPNYTITVVAEPNFTDIVSQSVKSVVHVKCPNWQGSGFVIDEHISKS